MVKRAGSCRIRIFLGLSALLILTPYSHVFAAGCCTVTSESSTQVRLRCPFIATEAQVRVEGSKSAALLRFHGAFDATEDPGTFIGHDEVAVIRGSIEDARASVVLNAFVDRQQRINYALSYRSGDGTVFTTSDLAGAGPECGVGTELFELRPDELPAGITAKVVEERFTPAQSVYSKLFGS